MTSDDQWPAPSAGSLPTPPPPPGGSYPPPGSPYPPPGGSSYPPPGGAPHPSQGGPWTSGPGWAPPPKPGLIPLRPLSFGTLIGAPFQALRRNPRGTFGSALLIQVAVLLASALVTGGVTAFALSRVAQASSDSVDTITAGSVAAIIVSALVPIALSFVGTAFLQGIVVIDVARDAVGEKTSFRRLWARAAKRIWPLTAWVVIVAVAVLLALGVLVGLVALLISLGPLTAVLGIIGGILGLIGLAVLGAWLGTKTSLVPSAIVLERLSLGRAVSRSWRLTTHHFWRTFGAEVLVFLIINTVSQVVTTPLLLIYMMVLSIIAPTGEPEPTALFLTVAIIGYVAIILVSIVIGAVTAVVQSAVVALIYLDLRMRKEGLDLTLTRYVETVQADPSAPAAQADPFAPPSSPAGAT